MVFLEQGLGKVVGWLSGGASTPPTTIILGSGNTPAVDTDTALETPVLATRKVFASIDTGTTPYTVTYEHLLTDSEGNGTDFYEVALEINSVAITRDLFPLLTKTSNFTVQTLIVLEVINE